MKGVVFGPPLSLYTVTNLKLFEYNKHMARIISIDEVKARIFKVHGDLVGIKESTYVNTGAKAQFIDKDYGEWTAYVRSVITGHGHPKRGVLLSHKNSILPLDEIQAKLLQVHGGLITIKPETYIMRSKKATFIDQKYGEWITTVNGVLRGGGHPSSHYLNRNVVHTHPDTGESLIEVADKHNIPYQTLQPIAQKLGIVEAIKYIKINLDENGKYKSKVSSLELQFKELLNNVEVKRERWNKKVSRIEENVHPDFQLTYQDKVLYVDVHGLYWHSIVNVDRKYHSSRRNIFEKAQISYLQFFEDEIRDKSEIVKSMILNHFGLTIQKYQARKLELQEVDPKRAHQFFIENHLMGRGSSSKAIGLFYREELVCCLSYRKSMRKGYLEISRFATKLNSSCAGGFGKLVNYLKQFNLPILSYCDLRYATGKSYQALGFVDKGTTLGFQWTDRYFRFNRTACKAGNGNTEKENAASKGWYKIYDAGQRKYLLALPTNQPTP